MNKSYNGFKNYNQWNVSLWLNNDEHLYCLMKDACRNSKRKEAVDYVYNTLLEMVGESTPDGVKWSKAGIRAAMVGI